MTPQVTTHSLIINLPPELFAEFCSFLPPADLFTLSQVCRKFRGYLCAPNSFSTQQIWKGSRLQFIKEDMPPPEGMSEEKYVELLLTVRGCQVCKRIKVCKIYWEFRVRSCRTCFSKNTVTQERLVEINCPREFIDIMPYHVKYIHEYYWIEQIDLVYSQYYGLSKKRLQTWLNRKKKMFDSIMQYAKKRNHRFYWSYLRYRRYRSYIQQFLFSSPPLIPLPSPPPPLPPSPPLSRFLSMYQLIQFHIQRLENELHHKQIANLANNYHHENSKSNDFINNTKKKNKRELYKYNKFNIKRQNKFSHKYG